MNVRCDQLTEALVDLAEGKSNAEARAHVDSCSSCAQRLEELRSILQAAAVPIRNAPDDLIARAKSILRPKARVTLVARLLGSSLATAGARSTAYDFQLMLEADDVRLRLMYTQAPGGNWEVTGRAPSAWDVERKGARLSVDPSGGFVLRAEGLDQTGFSLVREDREIVIPPARELIDGGNGSTH